MPGKNPGHETPAPRGYRWVYTPHFRHWRSGKIIYAANYGRKSFRFLVRSKRR